MNKMIYPTTVPNEEAQAMRSASYRSKAIKAFKAAVMRQLDLDMPHEDISYLGERMEMVDQAMREIRMTTDRLAMDAIDRYRKR